MTARQTPSVVLDTNIVLDWLLFRDAHSAALADAVTSRQVRWMVCARMREEFERTLTYPNLSKWDPDSERLLTAFDNWSSLVAAPPLAPPSVRCTDPDDQVFVDLALACGAHWLVSRDRAVLKLSRRVRGHGLQIIPPGAWRLTG